MNDPVEAWNLIVPCYTPKGEIYEYKRFMSLARDALVRIAHPNLTSAITLSQVSLVWWSALR